MKATKRILAMLLALVMTLALVACGDTKEPAVDDTTTPEVEEIPYPEEDINLVVPFGVGGDTDTTARGMAAALTNKLDGTTVAVSNVTGGTGTVAISYVNEAEPDGYTLLWHNSDMIYTSLLGGRIEDDWDKMFKLVAIACDGGTDCFVVRTDSGWETMQDLMDYALANPGKVTVGTEVGSSQHMNLLKLEKETGVEFNIVSTGGGSARVTALNASEIDVNLGAYGANKEFVNAGTFRALAMTADKQNEDINADAGYEIPTLKEAIGVDIVYYKMFMCFAPIDTDDAVVEKMGKLIGECIDSDDFKTALGKYFYNPCYYMGDEAMTYAKKWESYYKQFTDLWAEMGN